VIPLALIALVVVAFVLAGNGIVPLWVAIAAILAGLLVAAWQLDRKAGPGGHRTMPKRKYAALLGIGAAEPSNHPVVVLDRGARAGEPPGVNRGDDSQPRR
jgi:hypothetical protein